MLTREQLLKKLLKYAEELGKTPSEKVFYDYAEIGIYDLKRCGYANYGILVREANLSPNKFDKTKYSSEQLCDLFIKVIREEGGWPTRGLLDIRHFGNKDFPDSSTFYNKLGKTGDLAQTILEYVKDKQGYKDVVNVCTPVLEKYKNDDKTETKDAEIVDHGWVYLFKHGHFNQYRIGKTTDLLRRGGEIRIQLPERAILIYSIETADITGVETYWLNRFKSKQMNGDWFNLGRADVKEFKSWKRIF